jgi:tagatose 6-phosphate kinase
MILTVTPNPLLDFIIHAAEMPGPGGHRLKKVKETVGGKGINVARLLKTLGRPALALGFCGGWYGKRLGDLLREQGVMARFVETAAETRLGVNLIVDQPTTQTWWLEEGEELTRAEIGAFLDLFRAEKPRASFVAMSGTIPGRCNNGFYAEVLRECRDIRAEVYLDARGEPLQKALEVGGFFLKQNREESIETFGVDPFDAARRAAWIVALLRARVTGALITDGPGPVLLWDPPHTLFFTPPPVREISPVGSGDAALAGILYARAEGLSVIEAARWGIACGAADAGHAGPCEAEFAEVERLLPLVGVAGARR